MENLFGLFFMLLFFCVGAGITTLMSISDGFNTYFFRRKMANTRSMKEEIDGQVFTSRERRNFSITDNMIKVFSEGKNIKRRNEKTNKNIEIVAFWSCTHCMKSLVV